MEKEHSQDSSHAKCACDGNALGCATNKKSRAEARPLQRQIKARAQAGVPFAAQGKPVLQKRKASLEARRNAVQKNDTGVV